MTSVLCLFNSLHCLVSYKNGMKLIFLHWDVLFFFQWEMDVGCGFSFFIYIKKTQSLVNLLLEGKS